MTRNNVFLATVDDKTRLPSIALQSWNSNGVGYSGVYICSSSGVKEQKFWKQSLEAVTESVAVYGYYHKYNFDDCYFDQAELFSKFAKNSELLPMVDASSLCSGDILSEYSLEYIENNLLDFCLSVRSIAKKPIIVGLGGHFRLSKERWKDFPLWLLEGYKVPAPWEYWHYKTIDHYYRCALYNGSLREFSKDHKTVPVFHDTSIPVKPKSIFGTKIRTYAESFYPVKGRMKKSDTLIVKKSLGCWGFVESGGWINLNEVKRKEENIV